MQILDTIRPPIDVPTLLRKKLIYHKEETCPFFLTLHDVVKQDKRKYVYWHIDKENHENVFVWKNLIRIICNVIIWNRKWKMEKWYYLQKWLFSWLNKTWYLKRVNLSILLIDKNSHLLPKYYLQNGVWMG